MKTRVNCLYGYRVLGEFLSNEDVQWKKIFLKPGIQPEYCDLFYVIWQTKADALADEEKELQMGLHTARMVSEDERYYTLKNQRQRELFLLSEYNCTKSEAQDIVELMKPEMAAIMISKEQEEKECQQ